MGFWNALSDGEVKFDLTMILVAQNAEKMGFDLLKIEISKIRSRHLKRLEKVVVQQPSTERGIEGYTMFYWLFGIS